MKRIIALLLAVLTLAAITAGAAEGENEVMLIQEAPAAEAVTEETVTEAIPLPSVVFQTGKITEVTEETITIEIAEGEELVLNYDASTYLIDANTILPLDLNGRETDDVAVFHSDAMTMSLPPQTYAFVILGNIKEDTVLPLYTEVEDVKEAEDGKVIVADNGTKEIKLLNTAEISPYLARNIVTVADVNKGSKLLMWYDAITMSIPAYATCEKAVLLAVGSDIRIGGVDVNYNEGEEAYTDENGVEMIPLRVVAEALGFEVIWNNDERSVTLKKETFTSLITIGDENGGINRARILMQAKPVIKNDRTFVSMDYFKALEEALSI